MHPVEVYDILPDDEMWKYPCAQVPNHMKSFLYPERFMIHLISLVLSHGDRSCTWLPNIFSQVIFDSDPAPTAGDAAAQANEMMSQAMIRSLLRVQMYSSKISKFASILSGE